MTPSILSRLKKPLLDALSVCFWILLWAFAAYRIGLEIILPTPLAVGKRLIQLCQGAVFWQSIGGSMARIFLGFALGCVLGCVLAFLMHFISFFAHLFAPPLSIIRATPVASFIILLLVFLQDDRIPILISFLMVLPLMTENVRTGLANAPRALAEVANLYGVSRRFRFLYYDLPAALPLFASGARNGFGLAWKAGVAAEVLCAAYVPLSVGAKIYESKIYLETADLFAWTAVLILCSFLLAAIPKGILHLKKRLHRRAFHGNHPL